MKNTGGNFRLQSDRRQLGGLLLFFGFCSLFQPLGKIAAQLGPAGTMYEKQGGDTPHIWELIGDFCLYINGIFALIIGFMAAVNDWSHKYLTSFLIVIIQTAYIPYISQMSAVGKAARDPMGMTPSLPAPLIPPPLHPTRADVRFVGAMGILATFAYGFAFVGAFAFMAFALQAFNTGNPDHRNGKYYKSRLGFYSGMLFIAGLAQLMLGSYCIKNLGGGKYTLPVKTAMLIVTYPGIAVFIGLIQILNAIWGVARAFGLHRGQKDIWFQISLLLQMFFVSILQDVTEISYPPGKKLAIAAPTFAAISFGINVMPAFLDHKMRTLPDELPADYYSESSTSGEASETYTKEGHGEGGEQVENAEAVQEV